MMKNWHCLNSFLDEILKTGKFSLEKVPVYHIVDENEKKKSFLIIVKVNMNLLEKSDDEIIAIAKPIWANLVRTSKHEGLWRFH